MPLRSHRSFRPLLDLGIGLFLAAGIAALFWWLFSHLDTTWGWQKTVEYRIALWRGWLLTLQISLGALVGSCVVAALLLAAQRAPFRSTRVFSRLFIELVRGMPLLVLLLIGYYVIFAQSVIASQLDAIGLGGKVFMGTALLSIFTGAYVCEILRGGLDSIPAGQLDSARAVGFNRSQVLRYVVMPQALRRVLPSLAGKFVDLVKDSSLLTVIGIDEFTSQARAMNSATYGGVEAFLPLAVGYLFLTLSLSGFSHWLESRFRYQM